LKKDQIRTTAFLLTCGEPTTEKALECLMKQSANILIKTIRNVAPASRALQQMLDECETEFCVQVDADMLLNPDAIGRLGSAMQCGDVSNQSTTAMVCGCLWGDFERRPIGHVKLFRVSEAKKVGFRDVPFCDMDFADRINERHQDGIHKIMGKTLCINSETILGQHVSMTTPSALYRRWYDLGQRYQHRPTSFKWAMEVIKSRMGESPDLGSWDMAASMGFAAGLASDIPSHEKSYNKPPGSLCWLEKGGVL